MVIKDSAGTQPPWALWLTWVLISVAAYVLVGFAFHFPSGFPPNNGESFNTPALIVGAFQGGFTGLVIGLLKALLLRQYFKGVTGVNRCCLDIGERGSVVCGLDAQFGNCESDWGKLANRTHHCRSGNRYFYSHSNTGVTCSIGAQLTAWSKTSKTNVQISGHAQQRIALDASLRAARRLSTLVAARAVEAKLSVAHSN